MNPVTTRNALALSLAVMLAACASNVPLTEPAPIENRSPGATPPATASNQPGAPAATTTPTAPPTSAVRTVDTAAATAAAANAAGRIVYFDFDSFVLKDEFKPLVDAHAKALVANAGRRLVIEGHTDERGGREYNLALGQKRAEAVVRSLVLLGAKDGQLEATSYGEERPAAAGSDEAAWAKNRRAELKDR
jgi:peptidoglycan-associated lipoprotein